MCFKGRVESIKTIYQEGMRVKLIRMNDCQAPSIGILGSVCGVDDIGSVLVLWDTGSSLNVVLDEDEIEIIDI